MEHRSKPLLKLNTWFLPALVVLLLVLEIVVPYKGWVALLVGFGGVLLVGYLWARSLARGLHLTREMRFGWAQVGDHVEERFTLSNEGWASALWVEVMDHSTVPGYEGSRGTGAGSGESIRWRKEAVCTRRGLFTLGPTTLQAGDPFGLFTVSVHYPASLPFLVLPPVVPLPTIQVAPGGRAGEGRPRPHAPDRTISAASVREYAPGDSLRWIHWRVSAHHNELFVRLFDGTPADDWWILLDMDRRAQAGAGWDSTAEHGVILAASLAERGVRGRRSVGLVAHGEDLIWMSPLSGEGQRWDILRSLALVSPGDCSLEELLTRMGPRFGRYASLIIITPAVDGGWIEPLVPLLRRGIVPTVLLFDRASFGGQGDAGRVMGLLSRLGVAHTVLDRDFLDRPEARPGQQGHWEWQVTGTGKAIPVRQVSGDFAWRELV